MTLELNLQFFAEGNGGEKTEQPTEKKKSDARDEGQVAKSKEIENAFSLLAIFLILKLWVGSLGSSLLGFFSLVYDDIPTYIKNYNSRVNDTDLIALFTEVILQILLLIAPVLAVTFLVSFVCDVAQVKWHPTAKPLKPKASRMNPINGFKKIFSSQALIELVKAILKIGIVCLVAYSYLKKNANGLFLMYDVTLKTGIANTCDLLVNLGFRISIAYLAIAFADYFYQRWKHNEDLKMTKQEIKEEFKQQEGDPQIKGKIRQRMQEVSRRRMMQDLPKADVVITNPTHLAVAIVFDPDKFDAPYVLAKGADYLAAKIKEVARENDIEIVENKPVARMLYLNVEIGEVIPPEMYQQIAEILAFVYHLKGKA